MNFLINIFLKCKYCDVLVRQALEQSKEPTSESRRVPVSLSAKSTNTIWVT
jgi:hypothetical protein